MIQTPVLAMTHTALRRLVRVGSTVVLEATVSYPSLACEDGENKMIQNGISRFNEAYRTIAEAFLEWCAGTLAEDAKGDFSAAGVGAVYTFDRRLVTCRMEATPDGDGGAVSVRRSVTLGSRRGGVLVSREQTDRWRADLSLIPARRRKRPFP